MPSKRHLYNVLIGAACITAVVAISVALVGEINETTGRILFSCLVIAAYTGTGLAAVALRERRGTNWVVATTTVASVLGLLSALVLTWWSFEADSERPLQFAFCWLTVALAGAIACVFLLLDRDTDDDVVRRIASLTLVTLAIAAAMVVLAIVFLIDSELYYRALAAVAVLWVLGSLLSPVLRRMRATETPAEQSGSLVSPGSVVSRITLHSGRYAEVHFGANDEVIALNQNFTYVDAAGLSQQLNGSRFDALSPLFSCIGLGVRAAELDPHGLLSVAFVDGSMIFVKAAT